MRRFAMGSAQALFKGIQLFVHEAKDPRRDAPQGIGKGILALSENPPISGESYRKLWPMAFSLPVISSYKYGTNPIYNSIECKIP